MAVTADWEVEFRGLLIDGETYSLASAPEGLIGGVDVRTSDQPRLGRHGVARGTDYLSGRSITLQVEIAAPADPAGFDAAAAAFAEAFALGQPDEAALVFKVPGVAAGQVVHAFVRPRRLSLPVDLSYFNRIPIATVELYAADPYLRSQVEHLATATVAAVISGVTVPVAVPFTLPASTPPGIVTADNAGTAPADPVLRIFGPVADPTVRNETTGKAVSFDLDLAAGQWLDVARVDGVLTVLLNGTASRYSSLVEADLPELVPGVNSLRFSAPVPTGAYVEVRWRDAWK